MNIIRGIFFWLLVFVVGAGVPVALSFFITAAFESRDLALLVIIAVSLGWGTLVGKVAFSIWEGR